MEQALAALSRIPLFSGLSRDQLLEFQAICRERSFGRGEWIFSDGDEGEGFFVILSGGVKIFKLSPSGKEQILHLFGPGDSFGEVAVFEGGPFPANAQALQETRTLFFPRAAFRALLKDHPELALKLLADLSRKLREFTRQIESLALREIPSRLAVYLLFLAREQGGAPEVTLSISKGELANLLGTIPETLSRIFARLSALGLIRVAGRRIALLDPRRLEELAQAGKAS